MNTKERPTQNDSGEYTAEDFPGTCDDCGRFFLTVQAWSGHDCTAREERLPVTDGGELLAEHVGLSEPHLELVAELADARVRDDLANENHSGERLDYDPDLAFEAVEYIEAYLEEVGQDG